MPYFAPAGAQICAGDYLGHWHPPGLGSRRAVSLLVIKAPDQIGAFIRGLTGAAYPAAGTRRTARRDIV
jgi:hypothetical protein